ncbi:hypothetical protein K0M31_011221 [Melipona bicolor]|uniref:Uncharacterized protein n=1 Tax=Melipona bicolor TaxID=60889 RepID=A0AA40G946_9HYME|nr:hypothetical protein K0M31_011221 [Melipona bicolor]
MAAGDQSTRVPEAIAVQTKSTDESRSIGLCTEIETQLNPTQKQQGNLENPATTLPTCCPQYPPGSTLLECRLERDQPVAHVVQIPDERSTATQKTYFLVETKASKFGPSARIVSHPQDDSTPKSDQSCTDSSSKRPTTYCLESRECSEGPIARAVFVPAESFSNGSDAVTTLHTKKGEHPEQPCSKIVYAPATIDDAEKDREPRVTFFGCAASKKHATARITRCSRNSRNNVGAKRCFETRAPRDSDCPAAVGLVCPPERSKPCRHSVLEARIDECGPETRTITFPPDDDYYGYMESKACEEGPSAKITHQPVDAVASKLDHLQATCPSRGEKEDQRRDLLPVTRRNGLDPSDEGSKTSKIPEAEGPRGRVCPAYCCQPVPKPRSCSATIDPSCRSRPEKPKSCDDVEKRKLEKLAPCADRTKDCARSDEVPRITSEELLTRYREYMPANTLSRYEACRSKRNGLQDQCRLPVPRIVLELKRREAQCRE